MEIDLELGPGVLGRQKGRSAPEVLRGADEKGDLER
jgi:hypothetical protein